MSLYAYGGNGGYGGGGDRFGGRRDVAFEAQYQVSALLLELRQTHARLEMLLALTRHKDERLEGLEAENENLVSEVVELKAMIHKQRAQVEIAEAISEQLKDELKFVQREKEALQKAKDEEIAELKEKLQEEAAGAVDTENGAKKVPGGVKEDTDAESGKAAKTEENEIKEEEGNIDGLKIKADGAGGKEENAKIEDKVPEGDKAAELKAEKAKVDGVDAEDKKGEAGNAGVV
ncbi:hypothetical protein L5515_015420 [Caenorhabditis briggsae]|uniref:Uncharacterized protein n=1 Tax=Caenorhabditis briggsae TaxID=6238 RepID=A0AAE9J9Z3_CAEBR|nr:hypothetical protein L5515_015420 [Caenorhabditis briggsae]